MMEAVPWKLFQSISLPLTNFPVFSIIRGKWIEDAHETILDKKDMISNYEKANEWELRKKITNPYEAIFSGSDTNIFPSIANINPLSRSYFKMVEMLYVIKFWETCDKETPFISSHVCEGPGGFMQNIVEEAKALGFPLKNTYAITLKSTRSHIPGWKKSSKFLKKHSEIQLEYGVDMTGNILNKKNQECFCERARGSAIFTADGGFDFSLDYSKQEEAAFPLLLASFIMGLKCLKVGGVMIIKLFDIYSPLTRDLLIGTAAQFKSFLIYKPATSRPCNSERYFIGESYKGIETSMEWCKHLEYAQTNYMEYPIKRLIDVNIKDWSPDIQEALHEQIMWQEELQMKSIDNAISLEKGHIHEKIREAVEISKGWCEIFGVPLIRGI